MRTLTPEGLRKIQDIASSFDLSTDVVLNMLQAVVNGGGTMAQFNIPELGGGGQWMQGGMTMVGDMFNHSLQSRVNGLCGELSNLIYSQNIFVDPILQKGPYQNSGNWWPERFGSPASSGAQNNFKYGYFPDPIRRLAIETNGKLFIYDTLNHHISGVSQQQGNSNSFTVSSQFGTIDIQSLPIVTEADLLVKSNGQQSAPEPIAQQEYIQQVAAPQYPVAQVPEPMVQAPQAVPVAPVYQSSPPVSNDNDIISLIEKLAGLLQKGYITEEEFQFKKTDLLKRL